MKITNNLKKLVCTMALAVFVIGTGVVAYAETSAFTLTVNNTGYNQDNISKRTLKAGGSAYENICYVRATGFNGTGTVYVKSVKLNDSSIRSSEIALGSASSVNVLKNATYNQYAPSGEYYFLQGRFGASTGSSITVVGNYTP